MLLGSVPCDSHSRLSLVLTPSVRSQGCPNRSQKYEKKKENKLTHFSTITLGNLCTSLCGNIVEILC